MAELLLAARTRLCVSKDRIDMAGFWAGVGVRSTIILNDSPVEEKVWSSTPVMRVPRAKHRTRDRSM